MCGKYTYTQIDIDELKIRISEKEAENEILRSSSGDPSDVYAYWKERAERAEKKLLAVSPIVDAAPLMLIFILAQIALDDLEDYEKYFSLQDGSDMCEIAGTQEEGHITGEVIRRAFDAVKDLQEPK